MNKLWKSLLFLPLILFFMPRTAGAEEESLLKLSVLVEEALKNNPEITAAKSGWEVTKSRIDQVNILDDPEIGIDTWNIPADLDLTETRNWIFFARQRLPARGTLSLRKAVAETDVLRSQSEIGNTIRKIVAAVKITYSALYLAHKTMAFTEEHVTILKRFEQVARVKFSTGRTSSQADLLKVQVALARLNNDLLTQKQHLRTVRDRLNIFLRRSPRSSLAQPEPLKVIPLSEDGVALAALALRKRPVLKMARAAIIRSKQELALAKLNFSPDFQVSVKRFQNRGIPQANGWGFSASMNVPWIFHQKHDASLSESRHRILQEKALYEGLKDQTRFEVEDLLSKIKTAEQLVRLFQKEVLPKAVQSVKAADIAYQTDRGDFLDLLEGQAQLLGFRLEYHRAITLQNQEVARLEQVIGIDLSDFKHLQKGGVP